MATPSLAGVLAPQRFDHAEEVSSGVECARQAAIADGHHLMLPRHTQPNREHELLLRQLDLTLPKQPAPMLLSS